MSAGAPAQRRCHALAPLRDALHVALDGAQARTVAPPAETRRIPASPGTRPAGRDAFTPLRTHRRPARGCTGAAGARRAFCVHPRSTGQARPRCWRDRAGSASRPSSTPHASDRRRGDGCPAGRNGSRRGRARAAAPPSYGCSPSACRPRRPIGSAGPGRARGAAPASRTASSPAHAASGGPRDAGRPSGGPGGEDGRSGRRAWTRHPGFAPSAGRLRAVP